MMSINNRVELSSRVHHIRANDSFGENRINHHRSAKREYWFKIILLGALFCLPIIGLPIFSKVLLLSYVIVCLFVVVGLQRTISVVAKTSSLGSVFIGFTIMFFVTCAVISLIMDPRDAVRGILIRNVLLPVLALLSGVVLTSTSKSYVPPTVLWWAVIACAWSLIAVLYGLPVNDVSRLELDWLTGGEYARGFVNPITNNFERATYITLSSLPAIGAAFLYPCYRRRWQRATAIILVAVTLYISFVTETRSGIAAVAIGLGLYLCFRRGTLLRLVFLVFVGIAGALYFQGTFDSFLPERFNLSYTQDRGLTGRMEIWISRIQSVPVSIFGDGMNLLLSEGISSHNQFLDVLFSFGILGLFLYSGVLGSIGLLGWKWLKVSRSSKFSVAILTALVTFVLISCIDSLMFSARQLNNLVWFLFGVVLGMSVEEKYRGRYGKVEKHRKVWPSKDDQPV